MFRLVHSTAIWPDNTEWLATSVSTGTNVTPIGVSVLTRLSMEAFLSGTCILDSDQNQRPESTDSIFVQYLIYLACQKFWVIDFWTMTVYMVLTSAKNINTWYWKESF